MQERVELLPRKTHQAEEHRRRQQLRELLGEIAFAPIDERVDEVIDALGDVGLLRVHLLRREQRVEDLAVLRVFRRIDVQPGSAGGCCRDRYRPTDEKSSW